MSAFQVEQSNVETNIVMVDLDPSGPSASQVVARGKEQGLLFGVITPTRFRLVTHRNVNQAACQQAVEILTQIGNAAAQ